MRAALAAALTLVLLASCGSWDTGAPDRQAPERACDDIVDALAAAGERCGLEYARVRDATLATVAAGDCKNVTSIRDERQLREECLPSLARDPCERVRAGEHDASCDAQLRRPE